MKVRIRNVTPYDLLKILDLNEQAVPQVSPLDVETILHQKYGFRQVGTQVVENGTKEVAKFLK